MTLVLALIAAACLGGTTYGMLGAHCDGGPRHRGAPDVLRMPVAAIAVGVACIWLAMVLMGQAHFVDVPRWDIWDTVREIERYHAGTLSLSDWWRPHNEHRPLTARLVVLPTAFFLHWNHWVEFGAVVAAMAALFLTVVRFTALARGGAQTVSPVVLLPIVLVLFSPSQWENLLRGYHVHIVLGAVAPVVALLWLSTYDTTWRRLSLAIVAAIVGVFSFGTGLLAWPIGAAVLVIRREAAWRRKLAVWCLAAVVVVGLYLPGLPSRPGGLSDVVVGSVFDAVRIAVGVLVGLAMPVLYLPEVFASSVSAAQVVVVGVAGAALVVASMQLWALVRSDRDGERLWLFPATLMAFGAGALALASLGRASAGLYAMTASRYVVFGACFWTGLLLLAAMRVPGRARHVSAATTLLVVLAGMAAATTWPLAWPWMARDAAAGRIAREALRRGDVGAAAPILYPDPVALEQKRRVLEAHDLSLYRPGAR